MLLYSKLSEISTCTTWVLLWLYLIVEYSVDTYEVERVGCKKGQSGCSQRGAQHFAIWRYFPFGRWVVGKAHTQLLSE